MEKEYLSNSYCFNPFHTVDEKSHSEALCDLDIFGV
jgi:hypothetical protein